jgi:hypothetical protein
MVVGGRWSVVCGLWSVVCGLWFVVCGLWFVVCGLCCSGGYGCGRVSSLFGVGGLGGVPLDGLGHRVCGIRWVGVVRILVPASPRIGSAVVKGTYH